MKETFKTICIYAILYNNEFVYIGKTNNLKRRQYQYEWLSRPHNKHRDGKQYIVRFIRKVGFENIIFKIVEECSDCELNAKEIFWYDYYSKFYNLKNIDKCGRGGKKFVTEEERKKISLGNTGKKISNEVKLKMSLIKRGNTKHLDIFRKSGLENPRAKPIKVYQNDVLIEDNITSKDFTKKMGWNYSYFVERLKKHNNRMEMKGYYIEYNI